MDSRAGYVSIAAEYRANHIGVLPVRTDGSKAPLIPKWSHLQQRLATDAELEQWFTVEVGIAWVCGRVSGGLEVLDFDHNADEVFPAWLSKLTRDIYSRLTVIETPGFGYHVPYRCNHICTSRKIARSHDSAAKPYVESKGERGYVLACGSPAEAHPSGRVYAQVMGSPLPHLPEFTPEQRRLLWLRAEEFDESSGVFEDQVQSRMRQLRPSRPADADSPWEDFKRRATWPEVLEPHGWHDLGAGSWRRPGKGCGSSARVLPAADGTEVLVVFSTAAGVLAPQSSDHASWNKFEAYKQLSHGGDNTAAIKALRAKGFGR